VPLDADALAARHLDEDRALVGGIAVERPDADACAFGDAVGGETGLASELQKLSSSLQDRVDDGPRARLSGNDPPDFSSFRHDPVIPPPGRETRVAVAKLGP